ncbi:MAG: type II secretion system protein [Cyanobacteria bacterium SIG30]|nr:type II secretion system protein [Cyanobacteria bacterium SIG30]
MNKIQPNYGEGVTNRLAFTLAEVLITLAIIGVVAALTIPSVVTNYKNQETATRLKKVVSTLQNTTNLAISEYGPILSWEVGNETFENSSNFAKTYLIPYLKIAKECNNTRTSGCIYEGEKYTQLNRTGTTAVPYAATTFYLADGTMIMLWTRNFELDGKSYKLAEVYVDINGHKKPNVQGQDIFAFRYNLVQAGKPFGKIEPNKSPISDVDNITSAYGCNKNGTGSYCSAVIAKNGWNIPTVDEYVQMAGSEDYRALYPW